MRKTRLQNRISGSMFTLPVCAVITLLLWGFTLREGEGIFLSRLSFTVPHLVALVCVALIAYVLVEMNNVNMLIRVRSRLVSSVWLVSAAVVPLLHTYSHGLVAAVCLSVAYYQLFKTYQAPDSQLNAFHSALMLSAGSLFVPHLLFFLPFFLWHQTVFLRSVTLRSLGAVFLGLAMPFVVVAGYAMVSGDLSFLFRWAETLSLYYAVSSEAYQTLTLQQWASWAVISLWGWIGMVHYLSTSYRDRIQTRMLLYVFVCQFLAIETFVALQPQHLDDWMPLLMVTSAPLTAHFFALTGSRFTNALFLVALLSFCALGVLGFWQVDLRFLSC